MAEITERFDLIIIGSGIIGLGIGNAFLENQPSMRVAVVEKEVNSYSHASGRNSGVLHAGFYYSPDSLKAKLCAEGNRELRSFIKTRNLPLLEVGKVVVSRNENEDEYLDILQSRADANSVNVELKKRSELHKFEPLAKTFERFLWSPTTAVTNPVVVTHALAQEFIIRGGIIAYGTNAKLIERAGEIQLNNSRISAEHYINAAGVEANKIASELGVGQEYALVPFKGLYRTIDQKKLPLVKLVYPVPHPINPFLGVHFTPTLDGKIKIGPTAIPAFGRYNYSMLKGANFDDFKEISKGITALIKNDSHDMSEIIQNEFPKYFMSTLANEGSTLVPTSTNLKGWHKKQPGIRAQLVDLRSGKLEQDFVIRQYLNSTHILNAVSPGWTCAIPFGRLVVKEVRK